MGKVHPLQKPGDTLQVFLKLLAAGHAPGEWDVGAACCSNRCLFWSSQWRYVAAKVEITQPFCMEGTYLKLQQDLIAIDEDFGEAEKIFPS
ncbi:hypothetical protein AVEN_223793-1 [Araneus ventricosus]|uniref:Uncharacterized protein n=1 Tax=Araneus ventricosus TaxID=182803 RepID=A0A4Y2DN27_ARAVE|nr:hypothetical protein AVEN_223793-1 [Araneus ventricosus]